MDAHAMPTEIPPEATSPPFRPSEYLTAAVLVILALLAAGWLVVTLMRKPPPEREPQSPRRLPDFSVPARQPNSRG